MPSIRIVNAGLSAGLGVCVGLLTSVLCVTTYEESLDETETSLQRGIDRCFDAGGRSTVEVTQRLMGKTIDATRGRLLAFLSVSKSFAEEMGSFASRFPHADTSSWAWVAGTMRTTLFGRFEQVGGPGKQAVSSAAYINLGGDPKGGKEGYLAGLRDTGPLALYFYEAPETAHAPPDSYHLLYVLQEDGSVPDWWSHGGVWGERAPATACADAIADSPVCAFGGVCSCDQLTAVAACHTTATMGGQTVVVDELCMQHCRACPAAPPACADVIADSPACSFGGVCTCAQLTGLAACGSVATLGGRPVVVNDLCPQHCGACAATPCVDALPDSPACAFGGMCTCEQLTALAECGTEPTIAGQRLEVDSLCAKFCGVCSGGGATAGNSRVPIGVPDPLGAPLPSPPGTPCNLTAPLSAQAPVAIGDCFLPAKSINWTVWTAHAYTLFTEKQPHRVHWLGLVGLGSTRVSLAVGWCWSTDAYSDPVFGNTAGCVTALAGIDATSRFLSDQPDLPPGYRLYVVSRAYTPSSARTGRVREVHTDMLVAVSHGVAFEEVGRSSSFALLDVLHCTNATDAVISANCRHLLTLGDVRPGGDGERYAFDAVPPDGLQEWVHRSPAAPRTYYQRISNVTDDAGLNLRMVLLVPRDGIMREIDAELARTRQEIAADKDDASQEREDGLVVMAVVVAGCGLVLIAGSVWFALSASRPLVELQLAMARVAVMDLDGVDSSSGKGSMLSEVSSMYQSFDGMIRNLIEYRSYMPQSVLVQDDDDGSDGSGDGGSSRSESDGTLRRSASGSTSIRSTRIIVGRAALAELSLRKRRLTLASSCLPEFPSLVLAPPEQVISAVSGYIQACVTAGKQTGGIVDGFDGDRVSFSFNGAVANAGHCAAGVRCCCALYDAHGTAVLAVCSSGQVLAGIVGSSSLRKYSRIGPASSWLPVFLAVGAELCPTGGVLLDDAVHASVSQQLVCRIREAVTYTGITTDCCLIYQWVPKKPGGGWMYDESGNDNPFAAYNDAVRALLSGAESPEPIAERLEGAAAGTEVSALYAELSAKVAAGEPWNAKVISLRAV